MDHFKLIGVIGRPGSMQVVETLKRLKTFLVSRNLEVVIEEAMSQLLPGHGLEVCSREQMGEQCDLVIVIGGDGSLLGAARAVARYNVPVLGINRGSLGFLTDIQPDHLEEQIGEVLDGKFMVESRFLLEAELKRNGVVVGHSDALNEVVLHPGKVTKMIRFELFIDGQFVYSQRSDGLIVATPTGSTAYALSGGGPIMHPRMDAVVLVPMHPHTLSSRPLVIDGNSEIKIVIDTDNTTWPQLACDGQVHISAAPGDVLSIHKKPFKLRLIHPLNHNYYEVCRTKLGWGNRLA